MGWDGGSHIMDAVVQAVDDAVKHAQRLVGVDPQTTHDDIRQELDEALRPSIARIASLLADRGWDSQEEADDFWRWPQEMLGWDDAAYEGFLRHKVAEAVQDDGTPDEIMQAAQRLKTHTDKMKAGKA